MPSAGEREDRVLDALEDRLVEKLYQRILQREGSDRRCSSGRHPRGRSGERSEYQPSPDRRRRRRSSPSGRRRCRRDDGQRKWARRRSNSREEEEKREVLYDEGKGSFSRRFRSIGLERRGARERLGWIEGGCEGSSDLTRFKGSSVGLNPSSNEHHPQGAGMTIAYQPKGRISREHHPKGKGEKVMFHGETGVFDKGELPAIGLPGWERRLPPTPMAGWDEGRGRRQVREPPQKMVFQREGEDAGFHINWSSRMPCPVPKSAYWFSKEKERGKGGYAGKCEREMGGESEVRAFPIDGKVSWKGSKGPGEVRQWGGGKEDPLYDGVMSRGREALVLRPRLDLGPAGGKEHHPSHSGQMAEPDMEYACTAEQDPYFTGDSPGRDRMGGKETEKTARAVTGGRGGPPWTSSIGESEIARAKGKREGVRGERAHGVERDPVGERFCETTREANSGDMRLKGDGPADLCLSSKAPAWVVQQEGRGIRDPEYDKYQHKGSFSGGSKGGDGKKSSKKKPEFVSSHDVAHMPISKERRKSDLGKGESGKKGKKSSGKTRDAEPAGRNLAKPVGSKKRPMPSVLKGLGTPHFDMAEREKFDKLFNKDPTRLRKRVAHEFLANPEWGGRRMSRHLFNTFGAKVDELNLLFSCTGMAEMKETILRKYHHGDPEKKLKKAMRREQRMRKRSVPSSLSGGGESQEQEMRGLSGLPRPCPPSEEGEAGSEKEKRVARGTGDGTAKKAGGKRSTGREDRANMPAEQVAVPSEGNEGASDRPAAQGTQGAKGERESGWEGGKTMHHSKGKPKLYENGKGKPKSKHKGKGDTHTHVRSTPYQIRQQSWIPPSPPIVPGATGPRGGVRCPTVEQKGVELRDLPRQGTRGAVAKGGSGEDGHGLTSDGGTSHGGDKGEGECPTVSAEGGPDAHEKEKGTARAELGSVVAGAGWRVPARQALSEEAEHERIFGQPRRFGTVSKISEGKWAVTIDRHPTRLTHEEKRYALECVQAVPPAIRKHGFCPVNAPTMLRCPIGGGTCRFGILNAKTLRNAVQTHFNLHHKSTPLNTFEIKIENGRGGFTYIQYPVEVQQKGGLGTSTPLSTSNPGKTARKQSGGLVAAVESSAEQHEPPGSTNEDEDEDEDENEKMKGHEDTRDGEPEVREEGSPDPAA